MIFLSILVSVFDYTFFTINIINIENLINDLCQKYSIIYTLYNKVYLYKLKLMIFWYTNNLKSQFHCRNPYTRTANKYGFPKSKTTNVCSTKHTLVVFYMPISIITIKYKQIF